MLYSQKTHNFLLREKLAGFFATGKTLCFACASAGAKLSAITMEALFTIITFCLASLTGTFPKSSLTFPRAKSPGADMVFAKENSMAMLALTLIQDATVYLTEFVRDFFLAEIAINSSRVPTRQLGNFFDGVRRREFSEQGQVYLSPVQRVMLRCGNHFQIFQAIVRFVSISMVDMFLSLKFSAKVIFHYNPMFVLFACSRVRNYAIAV